MHQYNLRKILMDEIKYTGFTIPEEIKQTGREVSEDISTRVEERVLKLIDDELKQHILNINDQTLSLGAGRQEPPGAI